MDNYSSQQLILSCALRSGDINRAKLNEMAKFETSHAKEIHIKA